MAYLRRCTPDDLAAIVDGDKYVEFKLAKGKKIYRRINEIANVADISSKEINLLEQKSKGRVLSPLGVTGNELSASEMFSDLSQYMSDGSNVNDLLF